MSDLWKLTALQAVSLLRKGEVSPLEMVEASVARIEETDEGLNAMPTRCYDRARDHARKLMKKGAHPYEGPGALHGLPFAVKELENVAGVRTTYGAPLWADHVPDRSDIMVERLEERGGIVMGKSNVPEYGAGGVSFNEVLGSSANPWDQQRTPAGPRADRPRPLRRARCRSPRGRIWAAACVFRPASAVSSDSGPALASSPRDPIPPVLRTCPWPVPWRATCLIPR